MANRSGRSELRYFPATIRHRSSCSTITTAFFMNSSVVPHHLTRNGNWPNNERFPLLYYQEAIREEDNLQQHFSDAFARNGWKGSWVNGVYDYHHYHSVSHEVLGVSQGKAIIIFGGLGGPEVEVKAGDMVIIPAGVAHCRKQASDDFEVVGAYPAGQEEYDICREDKPVEAALENIKEVNMPDTDPLFGQGGPLIKEWEKAPERD